MFIIKRGEKRVLGTNFCFLFLFLSHTWKHKYFYRAFNSECQLPLADPTDARKVYSVI